MTGLFGYLQYYRLPLLVAGLDETVSYYAETTFSDLVIHIHHDLRFLLTVLIIKVEKTFKRGLEESHFFDGGFFGTLTY
jgi:hypothetical protein